MLAAYVLRMLVLLAAPAAAPPVVHTDDALIYALSPDARGTLTRAFTLTADEDVAALVVRPVKVRRPDGSPRAPGDELKLQAPTRLGPAGAPVVVQLAAEGFRAPGTYEITLEVRWQREEDDAVVSEQRPLVLTVVREKGAIRLPPKLAVSLVRWFPGQRAGAVRVLPHPAGLPVEAVRLDPVLHEDSLALAVGRVQPERRGEDLLLRFHDFEEVGRYTTTLMVDGSTLSTDDLSVPVTVQVTDAWPAPVLVIFLGVLAGFGVNELVRRRRPLRENALRMARLRDRIDRLRARTAAPDLRAELDHLDERLREAAERNADGVSDVGPLLEDLDKAIEAVATRLAQALAAAAARLQQVRSKATAQGRAAEVVEPLAAVEALLREGRADAAGEALTAVEAGFEAAPVVSYREGLMPARPAYRGPSGAPPAGPALRVIDPPLLRIRGTSISFAVDGAEPDCAAVWEFGDGTEALTTQRPFGRHVYREAGSYAVKVTLRRGDVEIDSLGTALEVRPAPEDERRARLREDLRAEELLLSAIALAVATLSALGALYFGKVFGTPADYATAFLWGFGVDVSVRGFGNVLATLRK